MGDTIKFHLDSFNIGHLILDVPNCETNSISKMVLDDLNDALDLLNKNPDLKALILESGKPDIFSAGADLTEFELFFSQPEKLRSLLEQGHRVYKRLGEQHYPTIALINGLCIGGGLELALACNYRVAVDRVPVMMGFPEVFLDIIPGWGGTQKMPKLVGLKESLDLILTGRYVRAEKAYDIKLIDEVLSEDHYQDLLNDFIQKCLTPKGREQILARRELKGFGYLLQEKNFIGRHFLFNTTYKTLKRTTRGQHYSPLVALELIKNSYKLPLHEGLVKETEAFVDSIQSKSSNARNVIALFLAREAMKDEHKIAKETTSYPTVKTTAVIGAGVMGNNIAWLLSYYKYPVKLKDVNQEALDKGFGSIIALYKKFVKLQKLKQQEMDERISQIELTTDFTGFQDLDIVIEAAIENFELKKILLSELENSMSPTAIIGSNTSSLKISELAKSMKNPERFVGMHFFNPPSRMPLVEIVQGKQTSDQTVALAVNFCKKIGKIPLVVQDCVGFLVNRIIVLGMNELIFILQETKDIKRLEKVMKDFGMVMGFFALSDEVGNDVSLKVMQSLESGYGERMKIPKFIYMVNEQKLLGKKSGKGFYTYPDKKINKEIDEMLASMGGGSLELSDKEILERCLFSMINEAARCLQEGVVSNPRYLDVAMVLGAGLPAFRGGLLRYANQLGIPYIVSQLRKFEKYSKVRFTPCELLVKMADEKRSFEV